MRVLCFAFILLLSGCSLFPSYQTPFSVRNPLIYGQLGDAPKEDGTTTYLAEKGQAFVDSYRAAKANETDSTIKKYIGTGLTYSHLLCKRYFDQLTFTKAHRDYAQKETHLTGGLVSAILGLASVNSAVVGGTAALFSFGGASFDTYNETFILSPDIASLEKLVKETQLQEEARIYKKLDATTGTWPDRIITLDQAERSLSSYIHHCTVNGITMLLDTSVQREVEVVKASTETTKTTGVAAPETPVIAPATGSATQ